MEEAKLSMIYAKDLKNLYLQERRIRGYLKAEDMARLKALQAERLEKVKLEAEQNAATVKRAFQIAEGRQRQKIPFNPAEFGFVFTIAEWNDYVKRSDRYYVITREHLDLNKAVAEYRAGQVEPKIA
jgi:hypothetical protein